MKSKTKQARVSGTLDPIVRLPKWAQRRIAELEERVKRAEATIPWTSPGMEWFTTAGIEGVVWWHDDGRMVKIKAKDFGIARRNLNPSLQVTPHREEKE